MNWFIVGCKKLNEHEEFEEVLEFPNVKVRKTRNSQNCDRRKNTQFISVYAADVKPVKIQKLMRSCYQNFRQYQMYEWFHVMALEIKFIIKRLGSF